MKSEDEKLDSYREHLQVTPLKRRVGSKSYDLLSTISNLSRLSPPLDDGLSRSYLRPGSPRNVIGKKI